MPRGPTPFGQWMRAIITNRPDDAETAAQKHVAMQGGARALIAGGCTMVWDSTTDGQSAAVLAETGLPALLFHEVLGLTRQRAEPILQKALDTDYALNPHAPYSVGPWLREQLKTPPATSRIQAWHLAETSDEEQLFQSGTGSIADLYREFRLPMPFDECPKTSSFQFLQDENLLPNCAIAFHGNQLTPEEASHFKAPRALVHCPSTHRWFQRKPFPLKALLNAGVNLCLGTDSLASSDTLSMLDMVRQVASEHPDLTADEILKMTCTNPTLINHDSMQNQGTIEPGNHANLVSLTAPESTPLLVLKNSKTEVTQTWIKGKKQLPM